MLSTDFYAQKIVMQKNYTISGSTQSGPTLATGSQKPCTV